MTSKVDYQIYVDEHVKWLDDWLQKTLEKHLPSEEFAELKAGWKDMAVVTKYARRMLWVSHEPGVMTLELDGVAVGGIRYSRLFPYVEHPIVHETLKVE